jgi:hypothetical protein
MTRVDRSDIPRSMISATAVNEAMIRNQTGQPAAWMSDNTSTSEIAAPWADCRKSRESAIVRVFCLPGQVTAQRLENGHPDSALKPVVHLPVMTVYPQTLWTSLCINPVGGGQNGLKAGVASFAKKIRMINIYKIQ